MEEKKICKICVLPEDKPNVWFDDEGVCNICIEHRKMNNASENAKFMETDFIKILNQNKGKGEYDCLVMCSGGKDSPSSLYYMKQPI